MIFFTGNTWKTCIWHNIYEFTSDLRFTTRHLNWECRSELRVPSCLSHSQLSVSHGSAGASYESPVAYLTHNSLLHMGVQERVTSPQLRISLTTRCFTWECRSELRFPSCVSHKLLLHSGVQERVTSPELLISLTTRRFTWHTGASYESPVAYLNHNSLLLMGVQERVSGPQ